MSLCADRSWPRPSSLRSEVRLPTKHGKQTLGGGARNDSSALEGARGLHALKQANEHWSSSGTGTAPEALPASLENRGSPRYKCEGSVEIRGEEGVIRTWGTITDISQSGCYVEIHGTFPLNAPLKLAIEIGEFRVEARGTVRTSYPLLGMGIAFTEIADQHRERLEALIGRLATGETAPSAAASVASSSASDFSIITNPSSALTALSRFFHDSPNMTREQFRAIISRSQR